MRKRLIILGVALVSVVIVGVLAWQTILPRMMVIEGSYIQLPTEVMMTEADLIFVGEVNKVSETKWNQDNHQAWAEGLPFHEVGFSIEEVIVGQEAGKEITLTLLGNRPSDEYQTMESGNHLQLGDRVVVFARHTDLAWRGNVTVPVTMFMSSPDSSVLTQGVDSQWISSDGAAYTLEELESEIMQQRDNS